MSRLAKGVCGKRRRPNRQRSMPACWCFKTSARPSGRPSGERSGWASHSHQPLSCWATAKIHSARSRSGSGAGAWWPGRVKAALPQWAARVPASSPWSGWVTSQTPSGRGVRSMVDSGAPVTKETNCSGGENPQMGRRYHRHCGARAGRHALYPSPEGHRVEAEAGQTGSR